MRMVWVTMGMGRRPTRQERLVAFVVRWAILSVAVWLAAEVVDGIHLDGWESTLIVALILGLLNMFIKPLLWFLSLPAIVLTLGFFLLIVNTAVLGLTAWIAGKFDRIHFDIDGFWDAFWGALIITIVSWVLGGFVKPDRVAQRVAR